MTSLDVPPSIKTDQRLFVTPLKPELLKIYLGPSLVPLAKNISYHSAQNAAEVGFGYLELPMAEAAKMKKKLHGSILKGHNVRIEDALPEKRKRSAEPEVGDGDVEESAKKKTKTRRGTKVKDKDRAIVLQGEELEEGRKVKRGWTETPAEKISEKRKKSKDAKAEKAIVDSGEVAERALRKEKKKEKSKREVSKYTSEAECLFRTKLPNGGSDTVGEEAEGEGGVKKKEKKSKGKGEVVVHEFAKTRKTPSFLKGAPAVSAEHATREYVDGKGWVDAEGNVLEAESTAQKEKRERKERRRAEKAAKAELEAQQAAAESEKKQKKRKAKAEVAKEPTPSASEASSPEPSSPEPSEDEDESSASEAESESPASEDETASKPSAEDANIEAPKPIHPLEALYKRPLLSPLDTTPKPAKTGGSFSFFAAENENDSDIEQDRDEPTRSQTEPQTAFNEADLEWRGSRSAAPTPDTAAIGKRFTFSMRDEEEDDEDDVDIPVHNGVQSGLGISGEEAFKARSNKVHGDGGEKEQAKEESEFAKWFFEKRGENNKKWKERRREAMKMKRKRENRRLTRRIV